MSLFPQLRSESHLTRWDPFNGANSILEAFSDVFNGKYATPLEGKWTPAMDIVENDKEILISLDVPGMDNKDLHVEIDNGALVIRGERKYEKETKEDNYLCVERRYGKFTRSFQLPEYADAEHIKAECKHGLLKVHVGKRPGKKQDVKSIAIGN